MSRHAEIGRKIMETIDSLRDDAADQAEFAELIDAAWQRRDYSWLADASVITQDEARVMMGPSRNPRWKVWTGPTTVRQVAEAYRAFPGVSDVLEGTEHVHFSYEGDAPVDMTRRGVPPLVRAYAIGVSGGGVKRISRNPKKRTANRRKRTSLNAKKRTSRRAR